MKEALTYMFKDNKYKEKALCYAGVALLASLLLNFSQTMSGSPTGLLLLLLGYIAMFIPSGYGVSCVKALIIQKENYILPTINVKNNFILGFKMFVAGIILGLAIVGICIAIFILFGIIGAFLIPKDISPVNAAIILSIPFAIFVLAVLIAYLIYGLVMGNIFAQKEWFTTFLRFKFATELISKEPSKYFSWLGIYIILLIVIAIITIIPGVIFTSAGTAGIIALSVMQAVIGAYTIFVFSYITAKCIPAEMQEEQ